MAIKSYKPTTAGRRGMTVTDYSELSKVAPCKSLLEPLKKNSGRNSYGRITVRHRGGKGIKCYKINDKSGNVIGVKAVNHGREIMIITTEGVIIRMQVAGISVLGRNTSGVKLINLDEGVKVAKVAKVREGDETKEEDDDAAQADGTVEE